MKDKIINTYDPIISYFHGGIRNTDKVVDTSLAKMIEQIKSNEHWKKKVSHVRDVLQKYGKGSEYREAKRQLHYFMPCGTFKTRSKAGLKTANGLIQGDLDNLTPDELKRARELLINDKFTVALFNSPSNLGIKFFIRILSPEPNSLPVHAVLHYYQSKYGLELDRSTLNLYQACYVSFDNRAMINLEADIFTYKLVEQEKRKSMHWKGETATSNDCDNSQNVNYCNRIIELEALEIMNAGEGLGNFQLNKSAFKAGARAHIGLSKESAIRAFEDAFMKRSHSKHTSSEFETTFNLGFSAGEANPIDKE